MMLPCPPKPDRGAPVDLENGDTSSAFQSANGLFQVAVLVGVMIQTGQGLR
jgi:hypothetical protein